MNNNNAGGQSPSRDTKNQEKSLSIHINPSHSSVHGEAMKNGDRSPTTSSASDLQVQEQEQLASNITSMSISPSSSPVRNKGKICETNLTVDSFTGVI
jgi:hypothetical protein